MDFETGAARKIMERHEQRRSEAAAVIQRRLAEERRQQEIAEQEQQRQQAIETHNEAMERQYDMLRQTLLPRLEHHRSTYHSLFKKRSRSTAIYRRARHALCR